VASSRPARLDLTRPRGYRELLATTMEVFARNAGVVLTLALIVVTPVTLLVDGVWGRALADGADARPPVAAAVVAAALRVFVILPLVTAVDVLIVQGLARGSVPAVGDALRAGARVFPRVVGAVIVYSAAVLAGLVLLIVPGIWLAIRGYFAAQAAVIDGLAPGAALRRSSELVQGSWWRTFAQLLGTALLFGLGGSVVIGLVAASGDGALYVAGLIVVEAVVVSLSAIFGTLLFHDLRARRRIPLAEPLDPDLSERPEDPTT
jgi:hypothetical protein